MRMVDLLSRPQGASNDELAEVLEVSRRTVFRVKNALDELGFPIMEDEVLYDGHKRWRLEPGYVQKLPNIKVPNLKLTTQEIIALYLLKGNAQVYKGTAIEASINAAIQKIGLFLPAGIEDTFARLSSLMVAGVSCGKDYQGKEEIIETLADAIFSLTICRVRYHSFFADEIKNFRIEPLHFFEREGGLYLFVRVTRYGDIRVLAVERIMALAPTSERFAYPKDFDPEALLAPAFKLVYDDPVAVRIRFTADQARYVKERRWATAQKLIDQEDGSVILEMDTSGTLEVKRWILSFGAEAEVLSPDWLRKEVASDLAAALKQYRPRRPPKKR